MASLRLGRVNRRDTLLAVLVASLWGFNFVVIDWGMGSVPPLLFAAIRFTVVAVPACFFVPRPPVPFRTVAAVGAFMSLGQFGLLYLSMHLGMPPGLAALVLQAQVVFTIVIAAVVLRERPSRAQVAGVALGVARAGRRRARPRRPRAGRGARAVPGRRAVLGDRQRGVARFPGAGRPGAHGLVGDDSPGAAARAQPAGRRARRGGARPDAPGLARRPVHRLHRRAVLAGRVRDLQPAAVPVPFGHVVPWVLLAPVVAMAAAWALLGEAPGPAEIGGAVLLVIGVLIAQGPARAARSPAREPAITPDRPVRVFQHEPRRQNIVVPVYDLPGPGPLSQRFNDSGKAIPWPHG